ncbi:MAG: peptidyl-prolyl cis-trans isomerase A (cyclophilin A) [Lentisphaeria bacterium]|jgi:peptidyl-prolyl cis-trans isomerase A (cyclophilin A)
MLKRFFITCFLMLNSIQANATIVQFQTVMGNFEVNLFDEVTPETADNFLAYLNADAYEGTIFHRSISDFVIQGGGFTLDESFTLLNVPSFDAITNEALYSNVRGTIAMAKIGGDPDSATSQWYFNVVDNSANLDYQDGGFTVFGQVIGDGMSVVDAINALNTFTSSNYDDFPLRDYTAGDTLDETNFVIIEHIVVLDGASNTAEDLIPREIVALESAGSDGGGGAMNILPLFGLIGLGFYSRRKRF